MHSYQVAQSEITDELKWNQVFKVVARPGGATLYSILQFFIEYAKKMPTAQFCKVPNKCYFNMDLTMP